MQAFKLQLILQFIGIVAYTLLAGSTYGWDLGQVFWTNLASLNWSGQFNYDFLCYLSLSGIWVAWRKRFTFGSIVLGVAASILGILFFAPYLLYLLSVHRADLGLVLLGDQWQPIQKSA